MQHIVQVAGIIDAQEADLLLQDGVDWLGFPLRLPSGKDDISEAAATAIIRGLKAPHMGVLISYMTQAEEVAAFCDALGARGVQLHGDISVTEVAKLRALRPNLRVLKSLVVHGDNLSALLSLVDDCCEFVDMFITDTFDPATGAKGATGQTHDGGISAELARRSPKPLMLAAGLTPENLAHAIFTVRPAAVDAYMIPGIGDFGDRYLGRARTFPAAKSEAADTEVAT